MTTPARTTGTPAPRTSGSRARTTDGNAPPPGSGTAAGEPFVPATYELPLLDDDGDNYELWSKALSLALRNRGLWAIINGRETAPDETADPTGHEEWCLKDEEAQLMVILALPKIAQKCIYPAQTAKECWDTLKARYGDDQRTASLLERFLQATLTDTDALRPQVDRIIFTIHQLESLNILIPDVVVAYQLIYRLPNSYSTLRTVLTSSDPAKVTSKWVTDQIIAEEHYRIAQSGGTASAFFTNIKAKNGKGNSGQDDKDKTCSHCRKKGHKRAECRKLKKEKEERRLYLL
jgi:hypothetical protein